MLNNTGMRSRSRREVRRQRAHRTGRKTYRAPSLYLLGDSSTRTASALRAGSVENVARNVTADVTDGVREDEQNTGIGPIILGLTSSTLPDSTGKRMSGPPNRQSVATDTKVTKG